MPSPLPDERTPLIHGDGQAKGTEELEAISPEVKPTPLPMEFYVLALLFAIPPLVFELIVPFINQMIVETGVANDPEKVGYYSGVIESIYAFTGILTVAPCAYFSDIIGRKPLILLSIIGLSISTCCFGMSQRFTTMIVSRAIGGVMGNTWGTSRVMTGEITDKSNQGKAFSWLIITYRVGQMMGLPLGGFLAHPERRFAIFRTPFWHKYPFSFPCFFTAGIALCSVLLGYFTLQETRNMQNRTKGARKVTNRGKTKKMALRQVLTPTVVSVVASNLMMGIISEMLATLYPIFAFTPVASGGLGASEATIGTHLGIRAFLTLPTLMYYTKLERRLGTVLFYQLVMSTFPFVVLCFPALNAAARSSASPIVQNALLLFYFLLRSWTGLAWACISVMVNCACPSAEALVTINGLSQMCMMIPQAISPGLATVLYATSIRSGFLHGHGIWVLMFFAAWAAAFHSYTIRLPESDWRDNREIADDQ